MFHAAAVRIRTDHVLSTTAFALILATWTCLYVAVCPPGPPPARHVAVLQVRP